MGVEGSRWIEGRVRRALPARLRAREGALLAALCVLALAEPLVFLVRYHPQGNVFFNRLAGDGMRTVRDRFEVDYWGLSYRARCTRSRSATRAS
jgi:hypothetical protein